MEKLIHLVREKQLNLIEAAGIRLIELAETPQQVADACRGTSMDLIGTINPPRENKEQKSEPAIKKPRKV